MKTGSHATWIFAATLCATACGSATRSSDDPSRNGLDGNNAQPAGTPESSTPTASVPARASAEVALQDEDWGKTWRLLATPKTGLVAGTPGGWIAVWTRGQDGTKILRPPDSFVYFSKDATHWHAIPTPGDSPLQAASVGYGGGHYLIAGSRGGPVVLDSTDGETWHEQSLDGPEYSAAGVVAYAGDRFFYVNLGLWGSTDGEAWSALPHGYPYAQFGDIAYGNGVYVAAGLQTQLSSDGTEWHAAPLDCTALPLNCYMDPDGNLYPNSADGVFFAEGRFHMWSQLGGSDWQLTSSPGELTSVDGESWQFAPGPFPDAYVAGRFTQFRSAQPAVWLPGDSTPRPIEVTSLASPTPERMITAAVIPQLADPPPPDFDLSWSDGVDCTNARCLLIHSKLYLVP
jgi:hypothetical protein